MIIKPYSKLLPSSFFNLKYRRNQYWLRKCMKTHRFVHYITFKYFWNSLKISVHFGKRGCHHYFSGVSGLTPYAPSPATVTSYSPSSSPTRTQSAQGSPTNSHKPWRPRARSADESTRKIVSNNSGFPFSPAEIVF